MSAARLQHTPISAPFDAWHTWQVGLDALWATHSDSTSIERRQRQRLTSLLEAAYAAPLQARRIQAALGRTATPRDWSWLSLAAIAPIDRATAMAHFDEACTNRHVTLAGVHKFLADPRKLGSAYLNRYAVWTSSGTSGTPAIWLHDAHALATYDALEGLRTTGLAQPGRGMEWLGQSWLTPIGGGHRYAMVGATGGHFAGNASVERIRRLFPWAAAHVQIFSILQPMAQLRQALEAFDPTVIATYPTAAELLATEHLAGRLSIAPREFWLGGEQLSAPIRSVVQTAFDCRIRVGYGASECLSIGWECDHGTLHVNADWVILEAVDRWYRPVPAGTPSHTVLLTNLANHVHPVIRYDLGDSITVHPESCPCGSAFPAIYIEGRRDDVLELESDTGGTVRLLPLALVTVLEDEAHAFDFQIVGRDRRTLVLRLHNGIDQSALKALRERCRRALRAYLDLQGLKSVRIIDATCGPIREPLSGKLRRVLHAEEPPQRIPEHPNAVGAA
jgi:phenylacetate-CoA ligase